MVFRRGSRPGVTVGRQPRLHGGARRGESTQKARGQEDTAGHGRQERTREEIKRVSNDVRRQKASDSRCAARQDKRTLAPAPVRPAEHMRPRRTSIPYEQPTKRNTHTTEDGDVVRCGQSGGSGSRAASTRPSRAHRDNSWWRWSRGKGRPHVARITSCAPARGLWAT